MLRNALFSRATSKKSVGAKEKKRTEIIEIDTDIPDLT